MSLKTCDGEHQADAPCITCDEDAKRCDLCWEEHPEDQHDDLRTFDDDEVGAHWRLCKDCYKRAQRVYRDEPDKDDERDWVRK